jgi:hypothetical protein
MAPSALKDSDLSSLTRRVSRRIFIVCIFSTLVPISVLAVVSFSQVTEHLYKQAQRRLSQSSMAVCRSIIERLSILENELKVFSSSPTPRPGASTDRPAEEYSEHLKQRFKGLAQITDSGKCIPFFGPREHPAAQSEEEKQHLSSGKTLVATQPGGDDCLHIYMLRAVDPQDLRHGILCGEINPMYLWGSPDTLPPRTECCVLDDSNHVMYSTIRLPPSFYESLVIQTRRSPLRRFGWKYEDKEYLASFWDIPLRFNFFYPKWTVVLSEPKDYVLAPMAYFKRIFSVVISLSVLVVLLVSIILIRKIIRPLKEFNGSGIRP